MEPPGAIREIFYYLPGTRGGRRRNYLLTTGSSREVPGYIRIPDRVGNKEIHYD